ncbi:divalent-cation tolerance protein CutA [Beggiatoa leptomitoformis]|uniref:Divalent cation tolerance protein CutA n=1 Tax=Beggiatoa leptomitoformis TaxID=288004 RepID=A0A2N9YG81_9GAMM|nr:divalent-cation tolerance protein CutA [Beggiatoa leptomitoformis]ALG68186.1 divalent cation tolerance protein CutA [Beggiatoa leptomitoformis]AUI69510.1 divalent cation tolerance protein CutA [Beggiatoa leptomitoformis]
METIEHVVLLNTCPSLDIAQTIAKTLVEEHLVACVSILPALQSVYLWEGTVQQEMEVLLMMKTRRLLYAQIEQVLQALHPYEIPELIMIPVVAGLPSYLQWINEVTQPLSFINN